MGAYVRVGTILGDGSLKGPLHAKGVSPTALLPSHHRPPRRNGDRDRGLSRLRLFAAYSHPDSGRVRDRPTHATTLRRTVRAHAAALGLVSSHVEW